MTFDGCRTEQPRYRRLPRGSVQVYRTVNAAITNDMVSSRENTACSRAVMASRVRTVLSPAVREPAMTRIALTAGMTAMRAMRLHHGRRPTAGHTAIHIKGTAISM